MGRYLEFIKTYRLLHRNSQKRIYFKDACYFITVKTFNNFPYFKESIFCDLFMENLRLCKRLKGFLLYGWVLVYNHFHLMVQPNDTWNISKVMQFFKRHITRDINFILSPNEGGIRESRLQGGKYEHLQSIVNEHDKKLQLFQSQFQQKYQNNQPFQKFQWKESFHDHYIRNENDFDSHMEYIAHNPRKHGLPVNWPYVYINPKYDDLTDEC